MKVPFAAAGAREVREEARLLAAIRDDAVVRLIESFELPDGRIALALELVDGACLAELDPTRLRSAPLSACAVAHVGKRICQALTAASGAISGGLVHRDVSPHNVLVSRAGHVKLADFGIARAWDRKPWTGASRIKGKLSYASPEQLLGGALDARSDLFALGLILFQLSMGKHPFGSGPPRDRARAILTGKTPRAHGLEPELARVILSLLERCPDKRPASTQRTAQLLGGLTNDEQGRGELARCIRNLRPGLVRCRSAKSAIQTTLSFGSCGLP